VPALAHIERFDLRGQDIDQRQAIAEQRCR
jgi:hypothetical protein